MAAKYSQISGKGSLIAGGKFGWVINKRIVLGGGFYGVVVKPITEFRNGSEIQKITSTFNYGGLEFEYILFPESSFHFSAGFLLAGGGITYSISAPSLSRSSSATQDFLAWEPSLNFEHNALSWLHIDLSLSYRIITEMNKYYNIGREDLSGLAAGLIFKFGTY